MAISMFVQQSLGLISLIHLARDIWRLILAGLVMFATVTHILSQTEWLKELGAASSLGLGVVAGIMSYSIVLGLLWRASGLCAGPERLVWGFLKPRRHA